MRAMRMSVLAAAGAVLGCAAAHATTFNISASGTHWSPATVTINQGDTVHWSYSTSHNVQQLIDLSDCSSYPLNGFDSGPVGKSTSFSFTFHAPGTFYFKCDRHCISAGMEGTVIVLSTCPGDATGDHLVNFADLNTVLSQFGQSSAPAALSGDVNGDGVVNFADLNIVLSHFGAAC